MSYSFNSMTSSGGASKDMPAMQCSISMYLKYSNKGFYDILKNICMIDRLQDSRGGRTLLVPNSKQIDEMKKMMKKKTEISQLREILTKLIVRGRINGLSEFEDTKGSDYPDFKFSESDFEPMEFFNREGNKVDRREWVYNIKSGDLKELIPAHLKSGGGVRSYGGSPTKFDLNALRNVVLKSYELHGFKNLKHHDPLSMFCKELKNQLSNDEMARKTFRCCLSNSITCSLFISSMFPGPASNALNQVTTFVNSTSPYKQGGSEFKNINATSGDDIVNSLVNSCKRLCDENNIFVNDSHNGKKNMHMWICMMKIFAYLHEADLHHCISQLENDNKLYLQKINGIFDIFETHYYSYYINNNFQKYFTNLKQCINDPMCTQLKAIFFMALKHKIFNKQGLFHEHNDHSIEGVKVIYATVKQGGHWGGSWCRDKNKQAI